MAGFTKFNARAFLRGEERTSAAAKTAKPAKARAATLAGLAAFAALDPDPRKAAAPADAWADVHEERAAIVEEGAGAPRAWAEALARLDPDHAPGGVPLRRWQQFIDDAGRFLDAGWAARAEALGWGALDLFGCDRERPLARVDHAGLLWLANGDKLIALTVDSAVIEAATGARRSFRRVPVQSGRVVLVWELN